MKYDFEELQKALSLIHKICAELEGECEKCPLHDPADVAECYLSVSPFDWEVKATPIESVFLVRGR